MYYDFSELVRQMDELNGTADEIGVSLGQVLTEIRAVDDAAELRHGELMKGISIVTVLLVVTVAIKVMFK